jgi:hypothetical protein
MMMVGHSTTLLAAVATLPSRVTIMLRSNAFVSKRAS